MEKAGVNGEELNEDELHLLVLQNSLSLGFSLLKLYLRSNFYIGAQQRWAVVVWVAPWRAESRFFGNSEKFQENLKEIPNFKKIATQLDIQAATAQLWSSDRAQMIFCSSLIQCHHWSQLIIFDVQLECAGQTLIHVFRQLCKTEFKKNSLQLMPHLFASYRVEWIRSGSLNIWRGQYRRCKLRFFEKIILWFFKGFATMNARSWLKVLQYICIIALIASVIYRCCCKRRKRSEVRIPLNELPLHAELLRNVNSHPIEQSNAALTCPKQMRAWSINVFVCFNYLK